MGPPARYRPMSPSRHGMIDPMRASTGTMQPISSYNPHEPSTAPQAYAGYPSGVPYVTPYDPRVSREPRLEVQPISSMTYRDPDNSTMRRTEYAIRPRQRSSTASAADLHQAHPRLKKPSPVVLNGVQGSASPTLGHKHYIVPASSSHRRPHDRLRYYTYYSSDTGQVNPHDQVIRARIGHGGYRTHEPNTRWRYPATGGLRKGDDIDEFDAYSYTNPREQFEKDSVARVKSGRSTYRPERPLSITGADDPLLRSKNQTRALGPPPSHRGFDKLDRDARVRRSVHGSDGSDIDPTDLRRLSEKGSPISLHQGHDGGYTSHREDYGDRRYHHTHSRRREDDQNRRQYSEDRTARKSITMGDPVASASGPGLGTAVLATGYSDDFDYDLSPRTDRHRSRNYHRHRSGEPSRPRDEYDLEGYSSDEDLKNYQHEPSARRNSSGSDTETSTQNNRHLMSERPRRRRSAHPRHHTGDSRALQLASTTSSQEDLRKAVVEPSIKEADAPPKGILKTPRDKFPEEPNPVREGVAPLKDAHKKGIPTGARWTKIDRRLVNPAALEEGNERFEERSDYVIVLRVLTKEEIQAYAVKTQEIRDARYQEYVGERRKRREEDRRQGRATGDFSSDDEYEDDDSIPEMETSTHSKSNHVRVSSPR